MTAHSTLPQLRVGWLGTGHMGSALATRLLNGGADVTVWNRTRSKAAALAEHGAKVADDLLELAACDIVFTMVSTSHDLEQVLLDGLLRSAGPLPRMIVDCSTVSLECSAKVREAANDRGIAFLASPVSGNGNVVRAGKLSVFCSGPRQAFEQVEAFLALFGHHVTYVGEGDRARIVKICHNVFLGVVTQSLAEITVLAEKAGITRAALLDAINNSVMGSVFSRYKSPAFVHLDFTPTFTPVLLRKDMDLGARLADGFGVPMPVAAAARETVQAAIAQGHTTEDFAVLLELQARDSGLELAPESTPVDDGLGTRA